MLTRFLFSGKTNIVFTDPKDRHIKHNLLPREKRRDYCSVRPWKEENSDWSENQHLLFTYWNLHKQATIICN